jgi:hypothetical protein
VHSIQESLDSIPSTPQIKKKYKIETLGCAMFNRQENNWAGLRDRQHLSRIQVKTGWEAAAVEKYSNPSTTTEVLSTKPEKHPFPE